MLAEKSGATLAGVGIRGGMRAEPKRATRRTMLLVAVVGLFASLFAATGPSEATPPDSSTLAAVTDPYTCPNVTDSVTRLYSAYFLRAPDDAGFRFWADQWGDGIRDLPAISSFFADSAEFQTLYGELNDREFVELIYQNVLGRPGEPAGVDFWTEQLATLSRGTVMLNFAESPEYVAVTGTEPPLAGYFSWPGREFRFGCGDPPANDLLIISDSVLSGLIHRNAVATIGERLEGDWRLTFDGRPGIYAEVNGSIGRPARAGPRLLSVNYWDRHDDIVVIGLGYNDAQTNGFRPGIEQMLELTSESQLVVLVTMREHGDGMYAYAEANAFLREQAAARPNVVVADWASLSAAHPEWVGTDGLHLTPDGAEVMADFLLATIEAGLLAQAETPTDQIEPAAAN